MKQYNLFTTAILFMLCALGSYFFFTFIVWIVTDYSYKTLLTGQGQIAGWMVFYWWFPGIFMLMDRDKIDSEWRVMESKN